MTFKQQCLDTLRIAGRDYHYYSLARCASETSLEKLPYALKILAENILRNLDDEGSPKDLQAILNWDPAAEPTQEIAFTPARVLLQDFTGVPAVVDLAAMRDAMHKLGGDPQKINPLSPAELVIDHSVQVDHFGSRDALDLNNRIEFDRNQERYAFLRWGQNQFSNFKVVPPNTGIVHQVNLEYLARVVFSEERDGQWHAWPDTLVGTDSHTTMINGLGVLGWGVGGIEAEAAMLGQPVTMLLPQVVGFRLHGQLSEGTTATDLVLCVTEILRKKGVVGRFVEFFGDGLAHLPLADRATIGNMSPEFGSTCAIFPIDKETLRYLELSGRSKEQRALVEAYAKAQGLWRDDGATEAQYSHVLELNLAEVEPSLAGPTRPQDRVPLSQAKQAFCEARDNMTRQRDPALGQPAPVSFQGENFELQEGAVVIAAITSCTNTSNPAVMLGAGLLARNAHQRGLKVKPWVKTSLAPGSKVVTDYLKNAGLLDDLEALGFYLVGYGCTTCIGNSGPLPDPIEAAIRVQQLVVSAVLSGNRNFEGRIHAEVRTNYLASPPLVVAYALAGTLNIDLYNEPLGTDGEGHPVYLREIWPDAEELQALIGSQVNAGLYASNYAEVYTGDDRWRSLEVPQGERFSWPSDSTYIQNPPYFEGMTLEVPPVAEITGARCLAKLADSVTTDHISPAGSIKPDSPAGTYLQAKAILPQDFNSYGSRRGNHEVMVRGTFANVRIRNELLDGVEGGYTRHFPTGEALSIYDAAMRYHDEGVPLIVLAGKEYGTGSSRDWAAKGTLLLGVRAVIAESFERIHRSNLVGMGVLPLCFQAGETRHTLGLSGEEQYHLKDLRIGESNQATVVAITDEGSEKQFSVDVRLDTPKEVTYYRHGGILPYVLRQLATS